MHVELEDVSAVFEVLEQREVLKRPRQAVSRRVTGPAPDELDAMANVVRLPRTTATGYYDRNFVTLLERAPARALVVVGDSITDGRGSSRASLASPRIRAMRTSAA